MPLGDNFVKYSIGFAQDSINNKKKSLRNQRLLTLLHIILTLYFFCSIFFSNMYFLAISQTVMWSVNLILDYFLVKKTKLNLNKSYTDYYETLKKYDNETYVKIMREKKLERVVKYKN